MQISWPQIITNILGFLILFWGLKHFAWQRILDRLDERKASIRSDYDSAEKAKQEAAQLLADYEAKLREIDATSRKRVEEALNEAMAVAVEMREKARGDANELLSKAQAEIERERAKARVALRNDMVQMVVQGVEKVLHERLTPGKHDELVMKFIDDLADIKA